MSTVLEKAVELLDFGERTSIKGDLIQCYNVTLKQTFDNDEYLDFYQFRIRMEFLRREIESLLLLKKNGEICVLSDYCSVRFRIPISGYINLRKMGLDMEEIPPRKILKRLGFNYITIRLLNKNKGDTLLDMTVELSEKSIKDDYARSMRIEVADNYKLINNMKIIRNIYTNNC